MPTRHCGCPMYKANFISLLNFLRQHRLPQTPGCDQTDLIRVLAGRTSTNAYFFMMQHMFRRTLVNYPAILTWSNLFPNLKTYFNLLLGRYRRSTLVHYPYLLFLCFKLNCSSISSGILSSLGQLLSSLFIAAKTIRRVRV